MYAINSSIFFTGNFSSDVTANKANVFILEGLTEPIKHVIDYELTRDGFQGRAMAKKILSLCQKVIEAGFIPVALSGDMGSSNVAA